MTEHGAGDGDADRHVLTLFADAVPEIAAGTVTIRALARVAGSRTKIAVSSEDPTVDPVEACVGPEAQRVRRVVEALGGERIDIVPWSSAPERMIRYALAPMSIASIQLDPSSQHARVLVPSEQLSKLGKDGCDLASRLSGWALQIEAVPPAA